MKPVAFTVAVCGVAALCGAATNRVRIAYVAELPAARAVEGISPAKAVEPSYKDVTEAVEIEGIDASVLAEVMAISGDMGIPKERLVDLFAMAKAAGLPVDDLKAVMRVAKASGLAPEELVMVRAAMLQEKAESVLTVYAAVRAELVTEEALVDVVMMSLEKGISIGDLKRIVALAKVKGGSKWRFYALSPRIFSRLWAVKMKAKNVEDAGGNTDELWKLYWDIFAKDAMMEGRYDE